MKLTKIALKLWVKTPFPSPMSNRKDRVEELAALQFGMENSGITYSHIALEQAAQRITSQSFRHEEDHLRLKY